MDTLKNILKLAIKIQDFSENREKLLKQLDEGIAIFEIAKVILVGTDDGPDILAEFSRLHDKIQAVSNDIKELGISIDWVGASIQYASICNRIDLGMEYCKHINRYGREGDAHNRKLYAGYLKELCSGNKLMLALTALVNGLAGRGEFTISIMDTIYKKTQGHRPKVEKFCCNLLQLFVGGLAVLLTHQTLITSDKDARTLEKNHFSGSYNTILKNINTTLQRCESEFLTNAENDMARILDHPSSTKNSGIVNTIHAKLSEKYDWVQFDCMVWDDCDDELFKLCGDYISKLHYHGKCAVAFYFDDARKVYDIAYKRAHRMVDFSQHVMTLIYPSPGAAVPPGRIKYSASGTWYTNVNNLLFGSNAYVVAAKIHSSLSIWDHRDHVCQGKGVRALYYHIRSVDREFFI